MKHLDIQENINPQNIRDKLATGGENGNEERMLDAAYNNSAKKRLKDSQNRMGLSCAKAVGILQVVIFTSST